MTKFAFALLSLCACGHGATLVRGEPSGGRIALRGAYMPAMFVARELMVEHCHGRYEMQELGDAVEFRCQSDRSADADALASRATDARTGSDPRAGRP